MKYLIMITTIILAALATACAPKSEPFTVQACIDGQQVAEFRDACLGPKPVEGEAPTAGQYDRDKCSTLQVRIGQFCDAPTTEPVEVVVNP